MLCQMHGRTLILLVIQVIEVDITDLREVLLNREDYCSDKLLWQLEMLNIGMK